METSAPASGQDPPTKNSLIIGGDINCTVRRSKELIGSAINRAKEEAQDMEEFLGFLQDFGLSLLNTWQRKPAHTCMTSGFKTQLDFLNCRVQHADACAKQAAPMHAEAIGRWKTNHHVPVFASYKLIQPYKLGKPKSLPNGSGSGVCPLRGCAGPSAVRTSHRRTSAAQYLLAA